MLVRYYAAALIAAAAPATAAAPDWAGRYTYGNEIGRNAGGFYMTVDYKLTIGPHSCRIDAEGYQTDEHIVCRAVPAGRDLTIAFVSYTDGKIANIYGTILYRPGQTLFTLSRGARGIVTRWGAYKPDATRGVGTYFKRDTGA